MLWFIGRAQATEKKKNGTCVWKKRRECERHRPELLLSFTIVVVVDLNSKFAKNHAKTRREEVFGSFVLQSPISVCEEAESEFRDFAASERTRNRQKHLRKKKEKRKKEIYSRPHLHNIFNGEGIITQKKSKSTLCRQFPCAPQRIHDLRQQSSNECSLQAANFFRLFSLALVCAPLLCGWRAISARLRFFFSRRVSSVRSPRLSSSSWKCMWIYFAEKKTQHLITSHHFGAGFFMAHDWKVVCSSVASVGSFQQSVSMESTGSFKLTIV